MRWGVLILLSLWTASADAADSPDYLKQIKPILAEKCFACHGALKQEAGLRLDTVSLMQRGGDSGAALVAGKSGESVLVQAVLGLNGRTRMPLEATPLTELEVAKLRQWIDAGAVGPADEKPEPDPREHWSFRKPVRPTVPEVQPANIDLRNPIDRFLAAQQQELRVTPFPAADKATLLRRVSLDLIGVPPNADEVRAFLEDDSPDAYDRVVKRMLDSPQHGERWGRHWMDVWRYSDWYGRRSVPDVMNSYPTIWRWRDWIVRSLNEDKGYDRMIVEMLAADELLPSDDANVVATGYLARSWFKWNYETWMKDLVEHSGKAFLGLTLNCAQCHDHKYDPIRQEEYFRFRAFFEPLELRHERVAGEPDPGPFAKYIYGKAYGPIASGAVRVFDEKLDAQTFMFSKGDSRLRIEGKPPVTPAAVAVLGGDKLTMSPISLPIEAAYPGMKPFLQADERAIRQSAITAAESALVAARSNVSSPSNAANELNAAEAALDSTRQEVLAAGTTVQSPVLAGSQSLVLDAKQGRRALSHLLPGLDVLAPNGTVSYLIQIVQDDHTNLQLALDIVQGATGGWVGFEKGTIKTYARGGFNEIVAGKYNITAGQNRFRVVMQLDLPQNRFLLTVTSLSDNMILADAVPAGLNGWQPKSNGKRGLFLDARPGTSAIYDDLTFAQPDGTPLRKFDFESPSHLDGREVVDTDGWTNTGYSAAPATSKVCSAVSLDPKVQAAVARVAAAQQAAQLPLLPVIAAESKLAAAKLELASLEARIAADTARYATGKLAEDRQADPAVRSLIHAACQAERIAAVATAKSSLAGSDHAIALAESKAAEAKTKSDQPALAAATKESQTAQQQRTAALNALNAANANLAKELAEYTPLSPKFPQTSTGRRAALAQWIAHRDNPLTARVAVNHLWLRHFGQPLVTSTHDFGRNGAKPTHPELLDWLACELMDSGWSMKTLHRLIVTSDAYRRASSIRTSAVSTAPTSVAAASDASLLADRDNRTYWRFPAARMQAEVVRDSLLSVAGELDATIGGQEIDHKLGLTSRRRSLYFAHHGEEKMEFLELFDAANPCDCYQRTSSVQPQQALALTNSELTRTLSQQLAQRLWSRRSPGTTDSDAIAEFVKLAFLQVLNREPRDAEQITSIAFLNQQTKLLAESNSKLDPATRSRENLIHALMNHNDFVTIR